MANPTTAFGWVMPVSSDLVSGLPTQFATFGQAVDTSMQYLLGGTTGQVLSKTSATNMAFTWIAAATNPLTTTGDIIYSSSGTTAARLPIGSTNQVLGITGGVPAWSASARSTLTATGDTLYASAANTLQRLAIGATGTVLTVAGGLPTWATPSSGSMTLLSTTTLSTGTTTISSISGSYKNLFVEIANVTFSTSAYMTFKPNGNLPVEPMAVTVGGLVQTPTGSGIMGNSTSGAMAYFNATIFNYASSTEYKNLNYYTTFGASNWGAMFIKDNTTISSLTLATSAGTFTAGTCRIYGVL